MPKRVSGAAGAAALLACATVASADIASGGVRAKERVAYRQVGTASWYGPGFHGKQTASGEIYDQNELTAAHRKLPLGTVVTVTNLDNGKKVRVEINDRGPYIDGRVIDLSKGAARRLDIIEEGLVRVRIEATPTQLAMADDRSRRRVALR